MAVEIITQLGERIAHRLAAHFAKHLAAVAEPGRALFAEQAQAFGVFHRESILAVIKTRCQDADESVVYPEHLEESAS